MAVETRPKLASPTITSNVSKVNVSTLQTTMDKTFPGSASRAICRTWFASTMASPLQSMMTSPTRTPASFAGEALETLTMSAPSRGGFLVVVSVALASDDIGEDDDAEYIYALSLIDSCACACVSLCACHASSLLSLFSIAFFSYSFYY